MTKFRIIERHFQNTSKYRHFEDGVEIFDDIYSSKTEAWAEVLQKVSNSKDNFTLNDNFDKIEDTTRGELFDIEDGYVDLHDSVISIEKIEN